MTIIIRVFKRGILAQFGQGRVLDFYDWVVLLELIREEDSVIVQDYTGERG